jgi:hypothetical protein
MGSLFKAHIFKERTRGPREEVKLKLFNLDGSPWEPPTPEVAELEAWQYVQNDDMNNGWHSLGAGYEVRFRKRTDNTVEFSGYLAPGTIGLAFYLPVSCRPLDTGDGAYIFPCAAYDAQTAQIGIQDDGQFIVTKFTPGAVWINIASVRFSTD